MKANKKQWSQIKKVVKANFGKQFQCKKMTCCYSICGVHGMNIEQASKLYDVLKSIGFIWSKFDLHYRNNPIHKTTDCIHADIDII